MNLRWKTAQFFETLWWRWYLLGKSSADYLNWKRNYWQRFFQTIHLETSAQDKILEVGSGPAGAFLMFPNHEVTAVEPLFEKYRRRFPHLTNGSFPKADFRSIPFEKYEDKRQFDLVFCLNAINHVADLEVCMRKLAAATAGGGRLFLSVDSHNFLFFKQLFRLVPADILHPHQFDLMEYLRQVKKAGLHPHSVGLLKKGFLFNYYLIIAKK